LKNKNGINVLSLFDGISCGQIAFERSGVKVNSYFASEIDKWAISVTQNNYPKTIQMGDITLIDSKVLKQLPKIDIVIGGSPCQDISNLNKKQDGLNGVKSGLFFHYLRILKYIKKHNNPNVKFLLENVRGKKESKDQISKLLEVDPVLINSNLVSGQSRNRLYWTNISSDIQQPKDKNIFLQDILENTISEDYIIKDGRLKWIHSENGQRCFKKQLCTLDGNKDNKAQCLTVRSEPGWNSNYVTSKDGRIRKLTEIEYERLQTLPDNYTKGIPSIKRYMAIGNSWTVDVVAHIFGYLSKK
jgi:site-specific DNA-cytosine methylase